jgi:hypothetical protein
MLHHIANIFCEPSPATATARGRFGGGGDDSHAGGSTGTGAGTGYETFSGNVLETEDGQAIKLE